MTEEGEEDRVENEDDETVGFTKDLSSILKIGTFNATERLQCSLLIESITADPISSIVFITRAAFMVPPPIAQEIDLDMNVVTHLYRVGIALQGAVEYVNNNVKIYDIETGSLDWEKDLFPWVKGTNYGGLRGADEPTIDDLLEEGRTNQEIFEITCRRLSEHGYKHLISDFLIYATPLIQVISLKVASKISSNTYSDLFRTVKQYEYKKYGSGQ